MWKTHVFRKALGPMLQQIDVESIQFSLFSPQ
jgi:hypothetical protein